MFHNAGADAASGAQAPIVAPPGDEGPLEPAYLRLFLLKYICPKDACFGTMALQQPGSQVRCTSSSVCGSYCFLQACACAVDHATTHHIPPACPPWAPSLPQLPTLCCA